MTKACTGCCETKPLTDYHRQKGGKYGRQAQCKTCRKAHQAEYDAKPEVKARQAEYYAENRDRVRWQQAEHYAENPDIWWESSFRQRALKYGFDYLIPSMQKVTREDLISIHGDKCKHCGGPFESADHWPIPVSQGGHHAAYNMVPSCMDCQRRTWCAYKPGSTADNTASSSSNTTNTDTTTKENTNA